MSKVTLEDVKRLRDITSAGMMDCKKALAETSGDFDAAVDWLRKKGIAKASKKAGRVAAEGLVAVCVEDCSGVVVEVNSETDFVSRNDVFQSFVREIAKIALTVNADMEALKNATFTGESHNVETQLTNLIAKIGENISLRRSEMLTVNKGVVGSYIHNAVTTDVGKIAVLVGLESEASQEALFPIAKQIAMHIAAAKPEALSIEAVSVEKLEREKQVLAEQARASGKSEDIIEKMMQGRLRKYYEEVVLLEQLFVLDGETKISKFLENKSKELGSEIKIKGYLSYVLGEGIEKKESDFASEVAATLGQ